MTHGPLNWYAIEDISLINGLAMPITFMSPNGSFEIVGSGACRTVAIWSASSRWATGALVGANQTRLWVSGDVATVARVAATSSMYDHQCSWLALTHISRHL